MRANEQQTVLIYTPLSEESHPYSASGGAKDAARGRKSMLWGCLLAALVLCAVYTCSRPYALPLSDGYRLQQVIKAFLLLS